MEAVAAINLHGLIDNVIEHFAAENFGDGTFDSVLLEDLHGVRGFIRAIAARLLGLIDQSRGSIDHGFQSKGTNGHLRKLGPHQTEIADGMPESGTLFGITRGGFELFFGETEAGSAQRKTAGIEDIERDDMAAANLVQQVFAGHVTILKENWSSGTATQSHFLFLGARGKSGEAALHDEAREFLAIDFCKDDVNVGESPVGNPHFLPIQHPVTAIGR